MMALVPFTKTTWDPESKYITMEDSWDPKDDNDNWKQLVNWQPSAYNPNYRPQLPNAGPTAAQLYEQAQDGIWNWIKRKNKPEQKFEPRINYNPEENWLYSRKKQKQELIPYEKQLIEPEDDYHPLTDLFNTMQEHFPEEVETARVITEITPSKINSSNFQYTPVSRDLPPKVDVQPISNSYVQRYQERLAARPQIAALKTVAYAARLEARAKKIMAGEIKPRRGRYRRRYRRSYRRRGYPRRWRGRGMYVPSSGVNFGGRLGGWLGAHAGEFLGHWGQRAIGLGDYSVRSNVFQGRLPEVTNLAGNGGTVIRFQEYLGDVITSATPGAFKIDTYMLNAANAKTFPWLSQIAANYDQFEIQGILFNFRSTSANALNSTSAATQK